MKSRRSSDVYSAIFRRFTLCTQLLTISSGALSFGIRPSFIALGLHIRDGDLRSASGAREELAEYVDNKCQDRPASTGPKMGMMICGVSLGSYLSGSKQ